MNKSITILFGIILLMGSNFCFGFSNKVPKNGMLGISFTPILPTGGDGHVFEDDKDDPHAEYGIGGGFDYWKRFGKAYDTHIGTELKYQQYHFHYGESQKNGQFHFLHLSIPASIHYPIPNYSFMFFKLGIALSSANLFQEKTGFAGTNKYISRFKTSWLIYPELTLGIDLLEEKNSKFHFRIGIDYTFIPISKMGEYKTYVSNEGNIEVASGSFTPNKYQIRITFYPIWKNKISFLKKGHSCPNPF